MITYTHNNDCECDMGIDVILNTKEKQRKLKKSLMTIDFDCDLQHFDDDGDEI